MIADDPIRAIIMLCALALFLIVGVPILLWLAGELALWLNDRRNRH